MSNLRRRRDETGTMFKGRHEFHEHEADVIRAYVTMKLKMVRRALLKYQDAYSKTHEPSLQGQIVYWSNIVSYLTQVLNGGMKTADVDDWRESWIRVSVTEKIAGNDHPDTTTQTIPGME